MFNNILTTTLTKVNAVKDSGDVFFRTGELIMKRVQYAYASILN